MLYSFFKARELGIEVFRSISNMRHSDRLVIQNWKNLKNQVWPEICQQVLKNHFPTSVSFFCRRKLQKPSEYVVLNIYWPPAGSRSQRRTIWRSLVRMWILSTCWQISEHQFFRFQKNSRSVARNGIKDDKHEPIDGSWPLDRLGKTLLLNNTLTLITIRLL